MCSSLYYKSGENVRGGQERGANQTLELSNQTRTLSYPTRTLFFKHGHFRPGGAKVDGGAGSHSIFQLNTGTV